MAAFSGVSLNRAPRLVQYPYWRIGSLNVPRVGGGVSTEYLFQAWTTSDTVQPSAMSLVMPTAFRQVLYWKTALLTPGRLSGLRRFPLCRFHHRTTVVINEMIEYPTVRIVDEHNSHLADLPIQQALEYSKRKQLDLVLVAPESVPPTCKMCALSDYLQEISEELRNTKVASSPVAFDPAQRARLIVLSASEADNDFYRKVNDGKRLLRFGSCVTFLLHRQPSVSSLIVGAKIQKIIAATKDIGIPTTVPARTSQLDARLIIPLHFAPCASQQTALQAMRRFTRLTVDDPPTNDQVFKKRFRQRERNSRRYP